MWRLKYWMNWFCISTTGSLIGMYLYVQFCDPTAELCKRDIGGLLVANLLITLLTQIVYWKEISSNGDNWIRLMIEYLGVTTILFLTGMQLEWLNFSDVSTVTTFFIVVTLIFIGVVIVNKIIGVQTAKGINEALETYKNRSHL